MITWWDRTTENSNEWTPMDRLDEALATEQRELDTVLLRLTTLRLLLATGKHRLVDRAISELQQAMTDFERAESASVDVLQSEGHETVSEAVTNIDEAARMGLTRRASQLRALHREVRVAMASTATATERALRQSAGVLDLDPAVRSQRRSNPFFTETD
jgi:hypothetical protein